MNPSIIWGTILILFGLALIFKSVFDISIPLIRPFFGGVLIYLGLHVMVDPFSEAADKRTVICGKSKWLARNEVNSYNIVFGSGVVDLSQMKPEDGSEIWINTVFGDQQCILSAEVPTKVKVHALCARAALPDETLISFGRNVYKTTCEGDPQMTVHIQVVFGNCQVKLAQSLPSEESILQDSSSNNENT